MASVSVLPELAQLIARVVRTVMSEVRPKLVQSAVSGDRGESRNLRHADNFLSIHDMWMHQRYKGLLEESIGSFVYASEEAEPQVIGRDPEPDLCILVDPLDTSELAVRGLHGYTHAMAYSRSLARPVVAVVGDIFHHFQLYVAAQDPHGDDFAVLADADATEYPLRELPAKRLAESLVTNYLMRPTERFGPLAHQKRFIHALGNRGRIGVDFGSVGLCHVAAGFTDAMVEFAKGFAVWDLLPGHYILHSAGGIVLDLEGTPLSMDYGLESLSDIGEAMKVRRKFVAAGSVELAREILRELDL